MSTPAIFNLETVLGLVVFFLTVRWYVLPWLLTLGPDEALVPLLLFSSFRFLSLSFFPPTYTAGLPAAWYVPAGWGDFTVGIIALVAAIAVKNRMPGSRGLAWLYAIGGTVDFLYAGSQAAANNVAEKIGGDWWIMTVGGPAWMVCIFYLYRLLIWPAPAAPTSRSSR